MLVVLALVQQLDANAGVEEAQLAQPLGQNVVVEFDIAEGLLAGPEAQRSAALVAGLALGHGRIRLTQTVALEVVVAFAPDVERELLRQRIHHRHTDAVQATGHLVAIGIELTAGVQHGHDDLGRRTALFLVDVHRNASTVVGHTNRPIAMHGHHNAIAVPGQRLVDGVVHHLEHHVMQTGAVVHVADVHAGALAHGFQATEDGDFRGIVILFGHSLAISGTARWAMRTQSGNGLVIRPAQASEGNCRRQSHSFYYSSPSPPGRRFETSGQGPHVGSAGRPAFHVKHRSHSIGWKTHG